MANYTPLTRVPIAFLGTGPAFLNGGVLYAYEAGTSTPATMYSDNSGTSAGTSVTLDSRGEPTTIKMIWLDDSVTYKFVLKDSAGTTIWTVDNVEPEGFGQMEVVANITALKALDTSKHTYAVTKAHTTAGDGGHAAFYYASGSSATDNNGSIIQPDTGGGRWLILNDGPLNVRQFGAVADGTTDDSAAIQAAIDVGNTVFLPAGTYAIATKLNFAADGQVVYGEGSGYDSEPARTILKWTGGASGVMFSVGDGTDNWQNCTLRDIYFNGNSTAITAIEAYDSTVAGGAWRNKFVNLYVQNLTGTSTGIDLGTGTVPDFSHDTQVIGCYFNGCTRGAIGAGSQYQFINTTFTTCTDGVVANSGSGWSFVNCVFSQSGDYDFEGTNVTTASFTGCWFEDSTTGMYYATTGHSVGFFGCHLHTAAANTTKLMDWGNAAGYAVVKGCVVGSTSGSTLIKNINAALEYDIAGTNCTIDSGYRIRPQGVTRADQASFAAGLTSDTGGVTGAGAEYPLTGAWTEIYDRTTAFDASTGTFTAPVYGDYHFDAQVCFSGMGASSNDTRVYLYANGVRHFLCRLNGGGITDGTNDVVIGGSTTVYLEAGQTAYLAVMDNGEANDTIVSILSGNAGVLWRTRFSGFLVG